MGILAPAQTAYVGEVWFVGFDFKGWVPSTITPSSNTVTATDETGADVTGDVISNALVSGTKSVATFSGFAADKTYRVIVTTTLSNGEIHKQAITITTAAL